MYIYYKGQVTLVQSQRQMSGASELQPKKAGTGQRKGQRLWAAGEENQKGREGKGHL